MPVERSPARSGNVPVLSPGEELRHSEPSTRLYAGQSLQGEGVLHLSNRRLVWLSTQDPSGGYAIDYPFITLHAVSRDKSAWPEPCLYCQLKVEEREGLDGEDEEEPEIPELRFVPADASHLQQVFMVFSEMSALNPDPADPQAEDSSSEEDDDEDEEEARPPQLGSVWVADDDDAAMEDAEEDDDGDAGMAMEAR